MKIVYFVHQFFPDFFYGTETYTFNLAKVMLSLGHEVTVVSAVPEGASGKETFISRYDYQGVPVVCFDKNQLPHSGFAEGYYQPSMATPIRDILIELQPDVVHVNHLLNHTAVLLEVIKELGLPVIATLTDFFAFCPKGILQNGIGNMCSGPNQLRSNCLSCVLKVASEKYKSRLLAFMAAGNVEVTLGASILRLVSRLPGFSSSKNWRFQMIREIRERPQRLLKLYRGYDAMIVPTRFLEKSYRSNGFDMPMYRQHFGVDIDRSPKRPRSKTEPLRFGYIGQLTRHKGVDLLVDAFRGVGDAELHIYGRFDNGSEFMNALADLALPSGDRVKFLPAFAPQDMASVLASIDVLIIPSRWHENSPLVLLAALATHTPVVISDAEGMTEFVEPGVNGFVFAMGNREELHNKLMELATDRDKVHGLFDTTSYDRSILDMATDVMQLYTKLGIGGNDP